MFEEQHRVVAAKRAAQQPDRILGVGRHRHLPPRVVMRRLHGAERKHEQCREARRGERDELPGHGELAPPQDGLRWGRLVSAACVRRGVLIRPLGDKPDSKMDPVDLAIFEQVECVGEHLPAELGQLRGEGLEVVLGRGDLAVGQVIKALYPDLPGDAIQEPKPTVFGRVIDRIRLGRGVARRAAGFRGSAL